MKRIASIALAAMLLTTPAFSAGLDISQLPSRASILFGQNADGTYSAAKLDGSGNVQTSASASIAGFAPTAGAVANVSDIVNVSQDVALPAGADIVVTNKGAVDVNFRMQAGAGTAVATDQTLKAGAAAGFHVLTATHLSVIAPTGTGTGATAGQVNIQGGAGLATGYGGGGGSNGTTNVTGINGVTPLVGAGATGTGSPRTTQAQDTSTVAGAAPTTTGIYVTGAAAAALATAANQPSNATQGSTTSGQTGRLVQCAVTTSAPSYTTAQTDPLSCTPNGAVRTLDNNSAAILTAAQAGTQSTGSAVPSSAIYVCLNLSGNCVGLTGTANGLKVDGSAVTQPASQSGTWTTQMGTTPACGSVIAISQTASTDLHTASGKTYICSIVIVSPDAEVVSLVEGTGSTCATGVAALLGATTAANGMSFAANGGFTSTGAAPWLAMQTTSDHLCLLQSGSGRIAGVITYNDH